MLYCYFTVLLEIKIDELTELIISHTKVLTLYLQRLEPPQWALISLTPGQFCCRPA